MACIKNNPVYVTVEKNLDYVSSGHSTIKKEDMIRVCEYVQGEHANSLYAEAINCSKNPKLAAEQFARDRDKYFREKKGGGMQGGGEEILAHHFYISFAKCDHLSIKKAMRIVREWLKVNGLDEYRLIMAPHVNTKLLHIHVTICAYHPKKHQKLHDNHANVYQWKKTLNRILVRENLSIIENKFLNKDPEYKAWFDKVREEGKIIIHKEMTAEEKKVYQEELKAMKQAQRENKNEKPNQERKAGTDEIKKEIQEEFLEQIRRSEEEERKKKEIAARYYYSSYHKPYKHHTGSGRYYSANAYGKNGRKRGMMELSLILAALVITGKNYCENKPKDKPDNVIYLGKTDVKAQKILNGISVAREYGINSPGSVDTHLKECGMNMQSLKKENYRLNKIIEDARASEFEKQDATAAIKKNDDLLKKLKRDYRNLKYLQATHSEVIKPEFREYCYPERPAISPEKPEKEPEQTENTKTMPDNGFRDIDDIISKAKEKALKNEKYKPESKGKDKEKDLSR